MDISLNELIKKGEIIETGARPKLPIKIEGLPSETLAVYRIPLKYLYYNNENGRIASEMVKNRINLLPIADIEDTQYNDAIAMLIRNSGSSALNRTKKDINQDGQKVFGYVLDDGRIIDGNRRFTALRELQKEKNENMFFEAVILPFSYDKRIDRQNIKSLELAIQMGVEERQNYDAVDLAVDIYHTTQEDKLLTTNEYAKKANKKIKEIEANIDAVKLMQEFLSFINADDNAYHLIKETDTFSLFYEMGKTLNSTFSSGIDAEVQKNQSKDSFFTWLLCNISKGTGGTKAYEFRDYKKNIIKQKENNQFNEDVEDVIDDIQDIVSEHSIEDLQTLSKTLTKINNQLEEFNDTYQEYIEVAKQENSIESFIKDVKKISKQLKEIQNQGGLRGTLQFNQLAPSDKMKLLEEMREIAMTSEVIFEGYRNEQ